MHLEEFEHYAAIGYNRIPVYEEFNDHLEIEHLIKLLHEPYRCLYQYENREGHKISLLGLTIQQMITVEQSTVTISSHGKVEKSFLIDGEVFTNPLNWFNDFLGAYRMPDVKGLPKLAGGALGYLSFDMYEFSHADLPLQAISNLLPRAAWLMLEEVLIVNHHLKKAWVIKFVDPIKEKDYSKIKKHVRELTQEINNKLNEFPKRQTIATHLEWPTELSLEQKLDIEKFLAELNQHPIDFITSCQYHQVASSLSPIEYFQYLANKNNLPGYFLNLNQKSIFGFAQNNIEKNGENLQVKTVTPIWPEVNTNHGMHEKINDRVKHAMGKACVEHTVSGENTLTGSIKPGITALEILKALQPFPSQCGHPFTQVMQVIALTENQPRSVFTGLISLIDWQGEFTATTTMNTLVHTEQHFHIGLSALATATTDKNLLEAIYLDQLATLNQ